MTLANFTAPALIFPHLKGAAAGSVLFELSRALQSQQRVPDWLLLYDAVLRKPSLASVNAKAEIAFPHARLVGVEIVSFAFGRCDKTIPWGADASEHVRMIFLISAPEDDPSQYLALLSGLISDDIESKPSRCPARSLGCGSCGGDFRCCNRARPCRDASGGG